MLRFILIHGALMWGVSTALLTQLIIRMTGNGDSTFGMLDSLIVLPLCGAVWGFFMWREQELNRKYPKRKSPKHKFPGVK